MDIHPSSDWEITTSGKQGKPTQHGSRESELDNSYDKSLVSLNISCRNFEGTIFLFYYYYFLSAGTQTKLFLKQK